MLGSAVSHIKELELMAEEALGFQILQTVVDFATAGPARCHPAALLRHGRAGLSADQRDLADGELPGDRHHQAGLLGPGDRALQEGGQDLAGRMVRTGAAPDPGAVHLRHRQPRFRRAGDPVAHHDSHQPQCRHPSASGPTLIGRTDHVLGGSSSTPSSRGGRRFRTSRRSGSWTSPWAIEAQGMMTYGNKGNMTRGGDRFDHRFPDRAQEEGPLPRVLGDLQANR